MDEPMAFLVERVTPGRMADHFGTSVQRRLRHALPFDVEVVRESRGDFDSTCKCSEVYRLTVDAVDDLKKRELYPASLIGNPKRACVCACMGRFL